MSPKERWIVILLALVQFTNIVDFMILMPLGPQLLEFFKIETSEFSFLVASYALTAGISGFLAVFYIDRFDRKKFLVYIYIGFILGTLSCALTNNFHLLLAARSLTGVFGGLLSAICLSIVSDLIPYERRATAMGLLMTSFSLAAVFGVPLGLYLSTLVSWKLPFLMVSAIAIINIVPLTLILPPLTNHIKNSIGRKRDRLFDILKNRNQLRALLMMSILILGQFTVIPFISPYLVKNNKFPIENLFIIYFIGGCVTIISSPLIGKLSDKYGKDKIFIIFAFASIIPLLIVTHMTEANYTFILFGTSIFFLVISGRMIPAVSLITGTSTAENRGAFLSINSSVQQLSSGLASLIAGAIIIENSDGSINNYNFVGYIAVAFTLIAIILVKKLKIVSNN